MTYPRFEEYLSDSGKTKVVDVFSLRLHVPLARIKWYGPWRQYVFEPSPLTLWNRDCLDEINAKITELMDARKAKSP